MLKRRGFTGPDARPQLLEYDPWPGISSLEDVARYLAGGYMAEPSVNSRNVIGNCILAWAARAGAREFDLTRRALFSTEIALNARDWAQRFSDETTELGVLKLTVVLVEAARSLGDRTADGDTFYRAFGPDIPRVVGAAYQLMVQSKTRR